MKGKSHTFLNYFHLAYKCNLVHLANIRYNNYIAHTLIININLAEIQLINCKTL